MRRFGARPTSNACPRIGRENRLGIPTERLHQLSRLIEADEHLLVPVAELCALQIGSQRLLLSAVITVALREIERVAGDHERVRLGGARPLEDGCIAPVGIRVPAASSIMVTVHDNRQVSRGTRSLAGQKLV